MDFQDSNNYSYSEIRLQVKEYEESQKLLLTERKIQNERKSSFKLICVKATQTSCPFRMAFLMKPDGSYEFKKRNSVFKHNHGKFSKKTFQTQFFKRDFKELESPMRSLLESGYEKTKPKILLKILREKKKMTPNILLGFSLYHKTFKKKFDNLVRKVKETMKNDISNSTASSLLAQSGSNSQDFEFQVKKEYNDSESPMILPKTRQNSAEDLEEKKSGILDFHSLMEEIENPRWFTPLTFY